MTTIYLPSKPRILHVVGFMDGTKRYRWTRTAMEKDNGDTHIHDAYEEVDNTGNLLFIPGGPDVDEVAVRDLTQMAKEKVRKPRERPDITKMYREFNERRKRELDTKTVHSVAKVEHD